MGYRSRTFSKKKIVVALLCILILSAGEALADRYEQDDKYRGLTDAANALYHKGRYAAALAKANQALALHADGQWAGIVKALSIRALGDYHSADVILKGLIKADPKFPEPHLYRALGFGDKLQFEPALAEMKIFSKLKDKDTAFPYTACLLLQSQKNDEAKKLCLEYLKKHPHDTFAKLQLAIGYAQDDEPKLGLQVLDSMSDHGKTTDLYYEWRAYCEALLGLDKAARKDLMVALQNQIELEKTVLANQITLLMSVKSPALRVYESICPELVRDVRHKKALQTPTVTLLEKRISAGDGTIEDFRRLGDLHWKAHDPKKAIQCYDRYLGQQPNANAFLARAKMYAALLLDDKAIADCDQALKLDPNLEEALRLKERCTKRRR